MATITNKTRLPLSVPLPGGKTLRLGPLKSGEVAQNAVTHPAVLKLAAAGTIDIVGTGHKSSQVPGDAGTGPQSANTRSRAGGVRKSGDR